MKFQSLITALALALTLAAFAVQSARADDREDTLKKRFEQRYPDLRIAEDAGKIGETSAGLVEAVDPKFLQDPAIKKLIEDEDTDRKALYQLIADQEQTTPDVVADRAGNRNFEKAKPGDYLKTPDGKWTQKK